MNELLLNALCLSVVGLTTAAFYALGFFWFSVSLALVTGLVVAVPQIMRLHHAFNKRFMPKEVLPVDEQALMFHDTPQCPRCMALIPEEQCYLKPYIGGRAENRPVFDTGVPYSDKEVVTQAGYGYCVPCDNFWTMMERATNTAEKEVQYEYRTMPYFEKQHQYQSQRICEFDERWNYSEGCKRDPERALKQWHVKKDCAGCGRSVYHQRHTLVERIFYRGPLPLIVNYLGIDECLGGGCRRREWVSRSALFWEQVMWW
jgi:hypothetical protein